MLATVVADDDLFFVDNSVPEFENWEWLMSRQRSLSDSRHG